MADQFITDITQLSKSAQDTLAANAKSRGMTAQEYLKSRGGIDPVTRKYGDSYDPNVDLTPAEYLAAIAGKTGLEAGKAINAATEAKAANVVSSITGNFPAPSSPEAAQLYEKFKGRAVSGVKLSSDEQNWLNSYLVHRSNILKGLRTAGTKLTPAQEAEENQLASIGVIGDKPYTGPTGSTTVTAPTTITGPTTGPTLTTPTSFTATDGRSFTTLADQLTYQATLDKEKGERQSAYDLLFQQFNQYGLGALVTPLKDLITSGASPAEFTIKLRETDAYKKRFAANAARIAKGLTAISEAEYIGLEDQYQNIMRNYGLPANYYTRGDMGRQEGFENFIANDVSAAELEDRVLTAQQRVLNANPEVLASLKQFYPGITNGDILAYTLDPTKALTDIKRKVTAAEIGGAATQAGLGLTGTRAEELGAAGITKQQAQQGFQTIAEVAPRGGQLAAIYGESPYTQQTAEQEVFGLAGSTEAAKQRKKLAGLERATFSGQTGAAQGALGRERAGNF